MNIKSLITEDQLRDIAHRSRLGLSKEHMDDFRQSFEKIVLMLDEISKVEVCQYKEATIPPVQCEDLRSDIAENQSVKKIEDSCTYYDKQSHLFLAPRVIEEE